MDAAGRFPVSHAAEIGPTDLHAVLRGHTPERPRPDGRTGESPSCSPTARRNLQRIADEIWLRLPLFHGGYFDAQYSLWAPGPIVRMQEDATAVYSPGCIATSSAVDR